MKSKNSYMNKALTVKQLIDKLKGSIDNGLISPDSLVFIDHPDKDSGNLESFHPVENITRESFMIKEIDNISLSEILKKEPVCLRFISQKQFKTSEEYINSKL